MDYKRIINDFKQVAPDIQFWSLRLVFERADIALNKAEAVSPFRGV